MNLNTIRAIIFLIIGLILILFPEKLLKIQSYITKKLNIKYSDKKSTVTILGIILIIISIILFFI